MKEDNIQEVLLLSWDQCMCLLPTNNWLYKNFTTICLLCTRPTHISRKLQLSFLLIFNKSWRSMILHLESLCMWNWRELCFSVILKIGILVIWDMLLWDSGLDFYGCISKFEQNTVMVNVMEKTSRPRVWAIRAT